MAFQAAADRSVEFQAIAAARLADPGRFDRLPAAAVLDQERRFVGIVRAADLVQRLVRTRDGG